MTEKFKLKMENIITVLILLVTVTLAYANIQHSINDVEKSINHETTLRSMVDQQICERLDAIELNNRITSEILVNISKEVYLIQQMRLKSDERRA